MSMTTNIVKSSANVGWASARHVGLKPNLQNAKGFTLVEMIIVIVITGIIGGIVAMFIKAPVQGYVDSARRAELTDIADTALRRMARDIRTAVPNSLRTAACSPTCIEFLPTKDGGRYRGDVGGNNNILTFGASGATIFDIVGAAIAAVPTVDYLVVGSTQSDGNPPYSQAAAGILRQISAMTNGNTTITFDAPSLPSSAAFSSRRFDVVDGVQQAVTYACTGTLGTLDANGNGQGKLVRYSGYGINPAQALPVTPSPPVLAENVSACTIEYVIPTVPATSVYSRFSLVVIRLTLTKGNESVTLYHEVHVNNAI